MDEKEIESLIGRYENELDKRNAENAQLLSHSASSFAGQQDPNLIEYQLELDNILERIEHLLKGHIIKIDAEGNQFYDEPENNDLKLFNEYGVQFMMNIISSYLNRNTILSNYTEQRINKILYDLGYELSDQIFKSYEKFGLDTAEKQKRYPIIVMQIIHMIESVYNRALGGEERTSLRTARTVMQSERLGNDIYRNQMMMPQRKSSLLKPWTWFKT